MVLTTIIKDNRPLPFSLSKDDSSCLSPRIIHKYALTVNLNSIDSIRSFIRHLNSNEKAITKPPLHIRGGYTSWSDTLHAIYIYYRIFDEDGRKAYNKNLKSLSPSRRERYNNNIDYLHSNRIFVDGRESIIQLQDVVIHPYRLPCANIAAAAAAANDEIDKIDDWLKQVNKNNLLHGLVEEQIIRNREPIQGSQYSYHDPQITSFLKEEFGEEISSLLLPLVGMKAKICCITVPPYTTPDAQKYNRHTLSGAQCRVEDLSTHPNAISDHSYFSATLIKFDGCNKAGYQSDFFVAINDGGYDKDALQQFREDDEKEIENGVTAFRPGPAVSRPGLHLEGNKKKEYLKAHTYYGKILLKEMTTYIKSMACLRACGIPPYDGSKFYMSDIKTLLHNNIHKLEKKEGLENVLIEYMLRFTEYRNHSAVTCDVDSISIEILSVIDRLGCNTNAYQFFPLNNIVYEFAVNESIAVTSLSNTLHVADPSRGHGSITKNVTMSKNNTPDIDLKQPPLQATAASPVASNDNAVIVKKEEYGYETDEDDQFFAMSNANVKKEELFDEDTVDEGNNHHKQYTPVPSHVMSASLNEGEFDAGTDDDDISPDPVHSSQVEEEVYEQATDDEKWK